MEHIEAELSRIEGRLAGSPDAFEHAGLYAAQQALRWAAQPRTTIRRLMLSSRAMRKVQQVIRQEPVRVRCQKPASADSVDHAIHTDAAI